MLAVAPRCHGSVQPPGARMILAQARRAARQGAPRAPACAAGLTQAVCPRNDLLFGWAEPFGELRLDEQLDAGLTRGLGQRFVEGGQGGPESFGEQQVGGVV